MRVNEWFSMDIQLAKKSSINFKKIAVVFIGCVVVASAYGAKHYLSDASSWVAQDKIRIATVEQGTFAINVRGLGKLKTDQIYFVSTPVQGKVSQILRKAGNIVQEGDIIAVLTNPQLNEALIQAQSLLAKTNAQNKADLAQLGAQLLDVEASIVAAELDYQANQLELDAQTKLISTGNSTVSKIDYQRTEFAVKRSKNNWLIQQKRLIKHQEKIDAQAAAQHANIDALQADVIRHQQNINNLVVKAPVAGIVQAMPLALGQALMQSDEIAKIADSTRLLAEIQVDELQAGLIELGQHVTLDTRQSQFKGSVSRIDPRVINGQVTIDVLPDEALPSEARPDLSVEGVISIVSVADSLFIRTPRDARANKTSMQFLVEPNGHLASATEVEFGRMSVNHIEIKSGLSAGQKLIISDIAPFTAHQQILIHQ